MDTIIEENLNDLFLGGLKDHIQHEVRMLCPSSVNESLILARRVEDKFLIPRKQGDNVTRDEGYSTPYLPQPTRLTPQQIEEKRAKGLCFNCDRKYSRGHKCSERNCSILKVQGRKKRMSPY